MYTGVRFSSLSTLLKWHESLKVIFNCVLNVTCSLEDDNLILDPAVAWKIIDGITPFDFDGYSVHEPIAVETTPILLQRHQ